MAFNKEQGLKDGVPDEPTEIANKIAILNAKLAEFGFGLIPIYNQGEAEAARKKNLRGLDPSGYERAILNTGST